MTKHNDQSERIDTEQTPEITECRICGSDIPPESEYYPFCSARCRQVDLGKWFGGEYKVSREIKDSDLDTVD